MRQDFSSSFLSSIQKFIVGEMLFMKEEKLLCAVSGGVDSMVMAFVLLELGYDFEIAHFNYALRGKDSDEDEQLVKNWAEIHQIPFHRNSPGSDFRLSKGISLQEEARNLRYEWMENLAHERGILHIVLAHHADDQVETIFLNLLRGAGLSGMRGMLPSQGKRKRPLLEKTRNEILDFAIKNQIEWREDASNAKNDYRRNQLRNQILPLFQEIAPGFEHAVIRNAQRFRLYETTLENQFSVLYSLFSVAESSEKKSFDLLSIVDHLQGRFFFFELLKKEGFGWDESEQLWTSASSIESIQRSSAAGILLEIKFPQVILWKKHNKVLVLFPSLMKAEKGSFPFHSNQTLKVDLVKVETIDVKEIKPNQWLAEADSIAFPLTFRLWKEGDEMKPFGMHWKKKKVSDLLTDAKRTFNEKSGQWVMHNADLEILWIPGIRSSQHSRLKEGFEGKVLFLEITG